MSFVKIEKNWLKLTETAKLNYGEVILLSEIASLSGNEKNKKKACTASNAYFASLLCTTERTIERYISNMRKNEIIKTFEDKAGMKTTTRYIYPQWKTILDLIGEANEATDNSDGCSEVAPDNFGSTTRQTLSNHPTILVKAPDNSDTLIINNKKEKENNKVADAPILAALDSANAVPEIWIPKDNNSHDIFNSKLHTDIRVVEIIKQEHEDYPHESAEYISNMACFYDTNKEVIKEYAQTVLGIK